MGRGRGKGKKQTVIAARTEEEEEEVLHNHHQQQQQEEEKIQIPVSKRRGKPVKVDDINDGKIEEDENLLRDGSWKKRKRSSAAAAAEVKENSTDSSIKEEEEKEKENSYGSSKSSVSGDDSLMIKSVGVGVARVGFRANGNRRKSSKPHRAAEVGVECN